MNFINIFGFFIFKETTYAKTSVVKTTYAKTSAVKIAFVKAITVII